jgi:uncharacterized protein
VRWLAIVLLVACSQKDVKREDGPSMSPDKPAAQVPHSPQASVYLATPAGDVAVHVEVVSTPAMVERGLMYRQHLPPEAGMLFLMEDERDWAFYMRNTLIPLDMIFIGRDMTIAGIVQNAEPRTETLRKVGKPSTYVLEVNGGWTAAHQVVPGAKVRFDGVRRP